MKLRKLLLAIAVCAVIMTITRVYYTSATFAIWDGMFELTVHVSSDLGPPRSVTCQAFRHREDAEYTLEHLLPPGTGLWAASAAPFAGEPLTVDIPLSGRNSMSGRELRRDQLRYLVVRNYLRT